MTGEIPRAHRGDPGYSDDQAGRGDVDRHPGDRADTGRVQGQTADLACPAEQDHAPAEE